jgi:hypothetical protein
MAIRVAGIAFLWIDGTQYKLRGNFTVSPSTVERTMIAGQDSIHGYQELPRVPFIEGDLTAMPSLSLLNDLMLQVNVSVLAQLANGLQYSLTGATCQARLEENTRDGQVRVRWEGIDCVESSWQ